MSVSWWSNLICLEAMRLVVNLLVYKYFLISSSVIYIYCLNSLSYVQELPKHKKSTVEGRTSVVFTPGDIRPRQKPKTKKIKQELWYPRLNSMQTQHELKAPFLAVAEAQNNKIKLERSDPNMSYLHTDLTWTERLLMLWQKPKTTSN